MQNYFKPVLVSVIIPAYNVENYIEDTINSVINQTYSNIELIVINDGSTDRTRELLYRFESCFNIKVLDQTNQGACAARNAGFKKSSGDYIQYLDGDDILSRNKIEQQIKLLNSHSHDVISSCGWAKFKFDTKEAELFPQRVWQDMDPIEWLVTAWSGGGMMQTACWLTHRSIIEAAGSWNEELKKNPNDDGEFFARVLLKTKRILFDKHSTVFYRVHSGERVSQNSSHVAANSLLHSYISYEENILREHRSEQIIQALVNNYVNFIYLFYAKYDDLSAIAFERIKSLGISKVSVLGNNRFAFFSRFLGFKNTLYIKSILKTQHFTLGKSGK